MPGFLENSTERRHAMKPKAMIVEVGPRDGFQNVKDFIPTEFKLRIIDGLARSGIKKIQCTSFVSPKHISQMRDAAEIVRTVIPKYPGVDFFALVPNLHGARAAVEAGIGEVSPVMSLSESHNRANVNRTREQSLEEFARMRQEFPDLVLAPDIATVFGCPFEGRMTIPALIELMGKIIDIGVGCITLCDTIGVANPAWVREVMQAVRKSYPDRQIGLHIHDTRNMGIINSYEGLRCGADSVQTAIGGLGGCPFAPGATGNTATEDLVYMLEREGYDTGIDQAALMETARTLHGGVEGNYSGHHIAISADHDTF
jgi:hydroxymethylglutaryl-CoA lyase